jgi:MYXO-CTERM domain-containing protein
LSAGALFAVLLLGQSPAHAHIRMEGVLKSRTPDGLLPGLDDAQKMSPCDGARSAGPVYTFQPGTTITLSVEESIPHPSYYRIAFDNDGEDGFKEPKSIKPIVASRPCPYDKDDQCGQSDFCNVYDPNGPRVLWDNLDPHASGGGNYSWNVTLPDIECENCTIQVIQVMEDTVHGAYCPQGSCAAASASLEDIYHRCINIKLKRGATNSPGVSTSMGNKNGIDCSKQAGSTPDAGVGGDAGVVDAGATRDAGAMMPSGTAGGGGVTGAGAAGGAVAGGGTGTGLPGGANSGTGGVGGGAAGGTVPASMVDAGASPVVAGATGGTAAGPGFAPVAAEDDDGCSVVFAGRKSSGASLAIALLGLALVVRRRRRA